MQKDWRLASLGAAPLAVALLLSVSALAAQQTGSDKPPPYPSFKFAARLHFQGYYFDNREYPVIGLGNPGPRSSFFTRRARIEVTGRISEHVTFVVQPSFENGAGREPNLRLRDAYTEISLGRHKSAFDLKLRVGQEKRPFGRYELTSANNLPTIERGAGRGLLAQSSNDLFLRAGFLSHDVGASLIAKTGDRGTVQAGIYNGSGESFIDNNDSKSFGLRVTSSVVAKLNVGASYFSHDAVLITPPAPPAPPAPADSSFRNRAFGVDAAWGKPGDPGLFIVADYMRGEALRLGSPDMEGLSLVGAYNFRLGSSARWLYAIEPVLRFDAADPNLDSSDDSSTLVTAVLGLYLNGNTQFRIAYEHQNFQVGGAAAASGLRTALTVHF